LGFWVKDVVFGIHGFGLIVYGVWFKIYGFWFLVYGPGRKIQELGLGSKI